MARLSAIVTLSGGARTMLTGRVETMAPRASPNRMWPVSVQGGRRAGDRGRQAMALLLPAVRLLPHRPKATAPAARGNFSCPSS
jgi:hypothetical protein